MILGAVVRGCRSHTLRQIIIVKKLSLRFDVERHRLESSVKSHISSSTILAGSPMARWLTPIKVGFLVGGSRVFAFK